MLSLNSETDVAARAASQAKGSAWQVYGRLVGHAWQYKGRLCLSLAFALLMAASFVSILVSAGTLVDLTFYKAEFDQETGELEREDPLIEAEQSIVETREWLEDTIYWAPGFLDAERCRSLVLAMRQDKMLWLKVLCVVMVVLSVIVAVARYFQEYFAGSIGARITTDLGRHMYANLVRQSVGFFETRGSGEILGRFTNDVFMVNKGLTEVFVKLMREPIRVLLLMIVALRVDPWLTLIGIGVLPPVAYILMRIGKKMRRSVRRSLEKIASMASVVNETIRGITIVKGYNMEAYEVARLNQELTRLRKFLFQMVRLTAATGPLTELVLVIGMTGFVLLSGKKVAEGNMPASDLLTLYMALIFMLDPIRKMSGVNNLIQTSVASAERVFELIDMQPEIQESNEAAALEPMRESLRFDHVHFCYRGKDAVLKGIDLEIRKGEMVALVGFSGAGKSTLVKLIPRFYDVSAGAVRIDGVDIRQASLASLRAQISIVTQDTILFAESIRANIAFGRNSYSDARVKQAAEAANAAEFIEKLPNGYDTVLGEGGVTLSGGQRQRLAIARAFIKDPSILILDEATSSLDSRSERLIQQALDQFVEGRTALVIAHRLSTIQRADRIIVIDDGRIVEQGTHEELLKLGGSYRRLYDTQFGQHQDTRG